MSSYILEVTMNNRHKLTRLFLLGLLVLGLGLTGCVPGEEDDDDEEEDSSVPVVRYLT